MTRVQKIIATGLLSSVLMAVFVLSAVAAPTNQGGVIVGEGDAPDCEEGSCGGVIVEDPDGAGPNCDGGNCGGSVCAGEDCGSCDEGNCGGSISGDGQRVTYIIDKKKPDGDGDGGDGGGRGRRQLPRTGNAFPTASTVALGLGLLLAGTIFTFVAHPATKVALATMSYRPKRRI